MNEENKEVEVMITWKYNSSDKENETFIAAESTEEAIQKLLAVKGADRIEILHVRDFNRMENP